MTAHGALERLLAGRFSDPDGGGALRVATRNVFIAPDLAGHEAALLRGTGLHGRHWAVVSDENTHGVLGARVAQALAPTQSLVLERPHADANTVARLRAETHGAEGLLAVGSGTLNDLCKYAAFLDRKPYAVFGTAPSMNGYTSPNAAITVNGLKKSLPAEPALAVFLDLNVLAKAPARLIRSGLGDSLCRSTAQADWLLAHMLCDTPYREAPFALLAEDEAPLFAVAGNLLRGDVDAIRLLTRTLVLSGLGMAICGNSMPASQGEHLISHYTDMMADPSWPAAHHGEQIGVTTLTMARLQEAMLASPAPGLRPSEVGRAAMLAQFGPQLGKACWSEFSKKRLSKAGAEAMSARVQALWPEIRRRIGAIRRPVRELEDVLRRAGAPTTPASLGWPAEFYRQAVRHAREIRDRWTFLDLAADSGVFGKAGQTGEPALV
jgi:glycerol-1-phosphate dehydrogenase [NAD(P)+]